MQDKRQKKKLFDKSCIQLQYATISIYSFASGFVMCYKKFQNHNHAENFEGRYFESSAIAESLKHGDLGIQDPEEGF